MALRTSGQIRVYDASQAVGAFALTAERTIAEPSNIIYTGGAIGFEISFFGVGADNNDFNYRLWGVRRGKDNEGLYLDYEKFYLGSGLATLGALTGVTGGAVLNTERIADIVTWVPGDSTTTSPRGLGKHALDAWNKAQAEVGTTQGDDIARVFLPDFGGIHGIIGEVGTGTATSGNFLIERIGYPGE